MTTKKKPAWMDLGGVSQVPVDGSVHPDPPATPKATPAARPAAKKPAPARKKKPAASTSSARPVVVQRGLGSSEWPQLNARVPEGLKETVVAEVHAAAADGRVLSAQNIVRDALDAYFLAREPRTDYARHLHEQADGKA